MIINKQITRFRRIRANLRAYERQLISRWQVIENLSDLGLTEEERETLLPPLSTLQYAVQLHKSMNLFWNNETSSWVNQSHATIFKSKSEIPKLPLGRIVIV